MLFSITACTTAASLGASASICVDGTGVSTEARREEKGTPVGVVYRAQGPALGSWEVQPPAACEVFLG